MINVFSFYDRAYGLLQYYPNLPKNEIPDPLDIVLIGLNYLYRSLCNSYNQRKSIKSCRKRSMNYQYLYYYAWKASCKYYTKSKSHILSGQHLPEHDEVLTKDVSSNRVQSQFLSFL